MSETLLNVAFNSTIPINSDKKRYTMYEIKVSSPTTMDWLIFKRYSDFHYLHSKLKNKINSITEYKSIKLLDIPRRQVWGNLATDVVNKRRIKLEYWLKETLKNPILIKDPLILNFLNVEEKIRNMIKNKDKYSLKNNSNGNRVSIVDDRNTMKMEERQINKLLKSLLMSKNRYQSLMEFDEWFFNNNCPYIKPETIKFLYVGNKRLGNKDKGK